MRGSEHYGPGGLPKVSFFSAESAQKKIDDNGWTDQMVYRCPRCKFWHHGRAK
jgi:hypothetical protein